MQPDEENCPVRKNSERNRAAGMLRHFAHGLCSRRILDFVNNSIENLAVVDIISFKKL